MNSVHSRGIAERGSTVVDWERVEQLAEDVVLSEDDAPELTDELLDRARPAREVLPELFPADVAQALLKRGRPKSENPKEQVTLRLSPEVLGFFRAQGKGWQTRIDQVLKEHISQ